MTLRDLFRSPAHFLAFGFGSGLSPVAPGTAGSLAAMPLLWGMSYLSGFTYVVLTIVAFMLGVKVCEAATRDLGVHDHGGIVWDEIVGMMIPFIFVPVSPVNLVAGFVLFRFFDILKPWPIRQLDRNVHGGFGVMLDDLIAGLFAALILWLLVLFSVI